MKPLPVWTCASSARIFLFTAVLVSAAAPAATMCVSAGDTVGLKTAIAAAASNGEDDLIELQSGEYALTSAQTLTYFPGAEQRSLIIEGGYTESSGNACGVAPSSPDARKTIIDGGQLRFLLPSGAGSIELNSITIRDMISNNQNPAAVSIGGVAASTGNIFIHNSMFMGNLSLTSHAINLRVTDGILDIENSLFALNASVSGGYPISLNAFAQNGQVCLGVINSSFTGNTSSVAALGLQTPSCLALLGNDVLWGNSATDIDLLYPENAQFVNDDLGDSSAAAGAQVFDLVSVNPLFGGGYSLQDASPLRDTGNNGAAFFFSPGEFDVIGNPRSYGTPDIGAFEIQDVIFASGVDIEWPMAP